MREMLQEARRMDGIGQLTGGIAHDFNNALMIISGCAEAMAEEFQEGHPQHRNATQILAATRGATQLARQLVAFTRKQVVSVSVFDLSKLVSATAEWLPRPLGEHVELVVVPNAHTGMVRADSAQLEQTLINLAVNAGDAMPEGGRLTLRTDNVELDAETQARIFEPFFTTKEMGTGLGLATVYGIMKQSGGYISLESRPGRGTTFQCYLPRFREERAGEGLSAPPHVRQKGTESVLLVEEDGPFRELVRDFMVDLGYQVLSASDGEQALKLLEGTWGPIHLMVSDLVVPPISGDPLAERLAQWHPETRVIYLSGYADQRITRKLVAGASLLRKPFELPLLARAMREVLDSPARQNAGVQNC